MGFDRVGIVLSVCVLAFLDNPLLPSSSSTGGRHIVEGLRVVDWVGEVLVEERRRAEVTE